MGERIYILVIFLLVQINLHANTKLLKADHYSIKNGLSQTSVTALFQDSRGFLWVGTQDGLNRYNGYDFQIFRHQPVDSTSICNNNVHSITEDASGNVWLGTNEGLSMYSYETGRFTNYIAELNNNSSLPDNNILNVYVDARGTVWVKTTGKLSKFVSDEEVFVNYEHFFDPFTNQPVLYFPKSLEDSNGDFWVGSKDGLFRFDRSLEVFERFSHETSGSGLASNVVLDIFEDQDKVLWVGSEKGVQQFNYYNRSYSESFTKKISSLKSNDIAVSSILEVDGEIWFGTENGLLVYNKANKSFRHIEQFISHGNIVSFSVVTSLVVDKSNILWVGTVQGLFKVDLKPKKFQLYENDENNLPLFESNFIASIYLRNPNELWVGTWGQGLFIYDRKKNTVVRRYSSYSGNSLNNDYVHSIFEDTKSRIWLGTRDGVQVYSRKTKQFLKPENNDLYVQLRGKRVHCMIEDHQQRVWFATGGGVFSLDNDNVRIYQHEPTNKSTLPSSDVNVLYQDQLGNIWAGTKGGLSRYNEEMNNFIVFPLKSADHSNPNDLEVTDIIEDENGFLWVSTIMGIYRIEDELNQIFFSEKDGLPNNLVYSLILDKKNTIWFTTNRGIGSINTVNLQTESYDLSDGLQNYEYNLGAAYQAKDGEIFFGGISGLNAFYPDSISKNNHKPNVEIIDVQLYTKSQLNSTTIHPYQEIEIPSDVKMFTIEFAALDFTWPEKNLFTYTLEGVNEEWVNLGNRNSVTFYNLRGGEYVFKLKGSNNDEVWSDEPAELRIFVRSSFWLTNTAYVLYVVIILGTFVFFVQYRTRGLRKANLVLKEKELAGLELARQKEELTIKNKNITDSLNYAKRIQEAMLPSEKMFYQILPNSFLLYKPKDIVSGDFFWINENKEKIFVAAVDCTGHGVPGAFMSIIGIELLRNITDVQKEQSAPGILNRLNDGIVRTFQKNNGQGNVLKDGMDCSLIVIDKKDKSFEFAGAFNSLYLMRNSQLMELKSDRFAVGSIDASDNRRFSGQTMDTQEGDMLYLYTDGYVDQFGGPEGKKYKYRRFRHLLLNIHKFPPELQRKYLDESIEDWKGEHEQVDDILIIGVQL